MSSLLLALARENPWPGIALASLNFIVALSLVGISLLLTATIAALAWLHAPADREPAPLQCGEPARLCIPSTPASGSSRPSWRNF
ncbi:hypothetical protein BSZ19_20015 [Bradyrhizobium japonicum]|uniref:Uncharacterized protein n=1 Tax=Bradyrhizobium japonicum TaxID=375 RepID=A0A1Y2JMZ4_BRAJP|nr:hypothetical protein BSZ19_20015 [Bradyrhizobium japonicum]